MCGIVGYAGKAEAAPILLEGLSKLEYRGYDSAGICVQGKDGFSIAKSKGRLKILCDQTDHGTAVRADRGRALGALKTDLIHVENPRFLILFLVYSLSVTPT